jgi:hypothetical protein
MSDKKEMTPKETFQGLVGLVVIAIVIWIYFSSGSDKTVPILSEDSKATIGDAPEESSELAKTDIPLIAEIDIKISTDGMKADYPSEIVDAAVTQKDREVSLVLIVKSKVTEARAKELGENFLRQVMSNSGGIENSPSKQIGSTRFSYLVGVYGPGEQQIALGAKAPASKWITW